MTFGEEMILPSFELSSALIWALRTKLAPPIRMPRPGVCAEEIGEVHGLVAVAEPDAVREGLRDRRGARRALRQARGVPCRAGQGADRRVAGVGQEPAAPLDAKPSEKGIHGLDDLGLDGDLLQLAAGDVLLETLFLGLLELVRGHDDDHVALYLRPQLLDVENRLESLVPGNFTELHRDEPLHVLAGHDVEAADLGDEAEDAPDVGILEIGRDLLSLVYLAFLLLDLDFLGLRLGPGCLDLDPLHFFMVSLCGMLAMSTSTISWLPSSRTRWGTASFRTILTAVTGRSPDFVWFE